VYSTELLPSITQHTPLYMSARLLPEEESSLNQTFHRRYNNIMSTEELSTEVYWCISFESPATAPPWHRPNREKETVRMTLPRR
jgi:hypothetical protein